jgi:outer membrane protein with beta-barrel domain
MTRSLRLVCGSLAVSLCALAAPASAQTPPGNTWSHGTTLDLFGGAALAPSTDTRGALGGTIGWEINRRLEIEGGGTWIIPRQDDQAFMAELKAVTNLTKPNAAVPFVGAGVGMYLATFESGSSSIPAFYQSRMRGAPAGSSQTFTDPSLVLAGGVNIFAGEHISLRPEVSIRWVLANSDSYPVTMVAVHAIYHFEKHATAR